VLSRNFDICSVIFVAHSLLSWMLLCCQLFLCLLRHQLSTKQLWHAVKLCPFSNVCDWNWLAKGIVVTNFHIYCHNFLLECRCLILLGSKARIIFVLSLMKTSDSQFLDGGTDVASVAVLSTVFDHAIII
jgi:hypothetical protein